MNVMLLIVAVASFAIGQIPTGVFVEALAQLQVPKARVRRGGEVGVVMRREREAPWSRPVFPYLGWIILGWVLTWAAVELHMLQRLLDTESLTGAQWAVVLGLSLIAPALVWADKAIRLHRQNKSRARDRIGPAAAACQAKA